MGWLSDTWKKAKDTVSDAWDGAKDAVKDVTGVDSINSLIATGGLAMVPANLSGKGILGEAITTAMNPLLQPYGQPAGGGQAMSGPLYQSAPAMSMGTGGGGRTVASAPSDLASYFGPSGYEFGPQTTSAALLQANPDAYQFSPLASSIS
jgi:hypothetical protein